MKKYIAMLLAMMMVLSALAGCAKEDAEGTEGGAEGTTNELWLPVVEATNYKKDVVIGDSAGFTMLDFVRFDFFDKEDLPYTFPEIEKELGGCRYTKCTHTKEEGCAILAARRAGRIPETRHASFAALYDVLKNKHDWDKK